MFGTNWRFWPGIFKLSSSTHTRVGRRFREEQNTLWYFQVIESFFSEFHDGFSKTNCIFRTTYCLSRPALNKSWFQLIDIYGSADCFSGKKLKWVLDDSSKELESKWLHRHQDLLTADMFLRSKSLYIRWCWYFTDELDGTPNCSSSHEKNPSTF